MKDWIFEYNAFHNLWYSSGTLCIWSENIYEKTFYNYMCQKSLIMLSMIENYSLLLLLQLKLFIIQKWDEKTFWERLKKSHKI